MFCLGCEYNPSVWVHQTISRVNNRLNKRLLIVKSSQLLYLNTNDFSEISNDLPGSNTGLWNIELKFKFW